MVCAAWRTRGMRLGPRCHERVNLAAAMMVARQRMPVWGQRRMRWMARTEAGSGGDGGKAEMGKVES